MSRYKSPLLSAVFDKIHLTVSWLTPLVRLGPSEFSFKHLEIGDLPLYNQDNEGIPQYPLSV